MKEEEISYSKAFEELSDIVSNIGDESYNVDELSDKVKRGAELIKICRNKLKKVEENVESALKTIDAPTDTYDAGEGLNANEESDSVF